MMSFLNQEIGEKVRYKPNRNKIGAMGRPEMLCRLWIEEPVSNQTFFFFLFFFFNADTKTNFHPSEQSPRCWGSAQTHKARVKTCREFVLNESEGNSRVTAGRIQLGATSQASSKAEIDEECQQEYCSLFYHLVWLTGHHFCSNIVLGVLSCPIHLIQTNI